MNNRDPDHVHNADVRMWRWRAVEAVVAVFADQLANFSKSSFGVS